MLHSDFQEPVVLMSFVSSYLLISVSDTLKAEHNNYLETKHDNKELGKSLYEKELLTLPVQIQQAAQA